VVLTLVSEFTSHLEEFRPSPRGFLEAEQEQVVVPVDIQARTKAGKEMAHRVLWLYELQDGKIIRAQLFADTADTLEPIR
jgi:ketosteroid isomerase-like protein